MISKPRAGRLNFKLTHYRIPIEIIGWDRAPAWHHLTFLALLVPGVLVGGALRAKKA